MEMRSFHLSIGCKSISESESFFENVLGAEIVHRDPSGYVNLDFYGTQVTLKPTPSINPDIEELHFGVNLSLKEFDEVVGKVRGTGYNKILGEPKVVDAGTNMERKKMYVKCPTGYIFEFKGYK